MSQLLRIRLLIGAILLAGLLATPSALLAQKGRPAPSAADAQATAPTTPTTTPTPTTPTTTPTTPTTTPTTPTTTPTPPAPPPGPCAVAALHLRCPDLIMSAPSEFHLDRRTIPGRVLLRATSSVDNHGAGPLELRAHRVEGHTIAVDQAIYDREGNAHLYPTAARLVFKYVPGERYEYGNVGAARYWKLEHAATFQLWAVDSQLKAVQLVRVGPKVDYCLRDLFRTHPSSASPSAPVYPGCNQNPAMRNDVLGTSVGWSDVYPYRYPEQWIDVTGLHGRFAYVQIADPDNLLTESNRANDVSETYVELPSARVLGHRVGLSKP